MNAKQKAALAVAICGAAFIAFVIVVTVFPTTQSLIMSAANSSAVSHYPKLRSAMVFSVLVLFAGALIAILIHSWRNWRAGKSPWEL